DNASKRAGSGGDGFMRLLRHYSLLRDWTELPPRARSKCLITNIQSARRTKRQFSLIVKSEQSRCSKLHWSIVHALSLSPAKCSQGVGPGIVGYCFAGAAGFSDSCAGAFV